MWFASRDVEEDGSAEESEPRAYLACDAVVCCLGLAWRSVAECVLVGEPTAFVAAAVFGIEKLVVDGSAIGSSGSAGSISSAPEVEAVCPDSTSPGAVARSGTVTVVPVG